MRHSIILIVFLLSLLVAGCIPSPYYQKEYPIPNQEWKYGFQPTFNFELTDTTHLYNIYFLIRHTDAYPFSNIWLWIYTKQPGDTTFTKTRIEVPLAEPSGKWEGRGMGEIWEQRMSITNIGDPTILRKRGKYEIRLEQNMRVALLPDVLQVGLRIEKGGIRKHKPQK
jgi:gliding motility-associated lipoprotein GldH